MKRRQWLILGIGSLLVIVLLVLLLQRGDKDKHRLHPRSTRERIETPSVPPPSFPPTRSGSAPPPIERGKGVAVVASSRMVDQRAVEFSNLVDVVWSAGLGTVFAAGDDGPASVKVPAGMEVNALEQALSRCAMSLLLWDEDVNQNAIKALKSYCETGGWLAFVSCPWIGSAPKSSPAELLGPRSFEGIAHVGAAVQDRKAVAVLKHPSLPELPVGERLGVYLQSSKALSGGEGRKIPLIRFEDPALRGITIQAMGHGGVVELNWDCPAGGRIGETDSQEFIKTVLAWLSGKDSWKEPAEQPGISLNVIARTPAGDPSPGAQIAVKVHTDWAKPLDQQTVTVDENGEADIPAKAPAIYTARAAGEGYSSDNLALGRVEEGTMPEPLVVIVRPSLRIVGTAVYTGEQTGPASDVQVDLLPSSRARGLDVVSAVTDKEGRFTFDQVPCGRPYLLRCETEEWAALEEIDLPESAETGTFEVTLSLKKLVAIDGRVVEEGEEEKPIQGATLRVEPGWGVKGVRLFSHHLRGQSASTDGEGEFAMLVLPEVTYRLRAEAPGYAWREQGSEGIWQGWSDRTLDGWLELQAPTTVMIVLYHATTVKGIVCLPGGLPAPGASVTLLRSASGLIATNSVQMADSEGRFCFPCVTVTNRPPPPSKVKYLMLAAKAGPYHGFRSETLPVEQKEIEVVLNLEESSVIAIRGIVTDVAERPVAAAGIYEGDTRGRCIAQTDDGGFFEASFPLTGGVSVWKKGYVAVHPDDSELEVAARDNSPLRVILPRGEGRVAGRIVLHDGTPLRNETADIWVSSEAAGILRILSMVTLGDMGDFELSGIPVDATKREVFGAPVESVDLRVHWYPDPKSQEVRVTGAKKGIPLGTSDAVVRLEPIGELRGRFVDGGNGGVIGGVFVRASEEIVFRSSRSDASGEFRVPWMSPGKYHLTATCPGYFPWEKKLEIGPEGENLRDIFLYNSFIVQGQVVSGETGMSLENTRVSIMAGTYIAWPKERRVRWGELAFGATDSAGRFSVRVSNPFSDTVLTQERASHDVSIVIDDGAAYLQFPLPVSDLGVSGVLDLGRVELKAPEE